MLMVAVHGTDSKIANDGSRGNDGSINIDIDAWLQWYIEGY